MLGDRKTKRGFKSRLRELRNLNRQARKIGDRTEYNLAIYRQARRIARSDDTVRVLQLLGLRAASDLGDIVAAILRRTSEDDRRLVCKHATALKLMALMDVRPTSLLKELADFGGYNACAAYYRETRIA